MASATVPQDAAPASAPVTSTPVPSVPSASAPSAPAPSTVTQPWYRREPWIVVMLAALVPVLVGFETPQRFHAPLMVLSGALLLVSFGMLVRQGVFRSNEPRAKPPAPRHR
jgi:hypothetical protein